MKYRNLWRKSLLVLTHMDESIFCKKMETLPCFHKKEKSDAAVQFFIRADLCASFGEAQHYPRMAENALIALYWEFFREL